MGRRNINTTKSGKFMNPTDRARKEARRRELKKNKKQRQQVRQAVLKSKDACVLLEEAEVYDRQEFDPKCSTSLSDRVLQEKRKKLLETFDRMILLYRKEEPDKAGDLQTMRNEYERKRGEMIMFYEQVKLAEKVNANEIPLPEIPPENQFQIPAFLGDIPLPPGVNIPPHPAILAAAAMASASAPAKGILKRHSEQIPGPPPGLPSLYKKPCAPPPGTPDELSDVDSEDGDIEPSDLSDNKPKKIRFSDDGNDNDEKDTRLTMSKAMAMSEMPPLSMIPPPGFMLPPNRIPVPTGLPPPLPVLGVPGYHPNPSSISMPAQIFSKPQRVLVTNNAVQKKDIHQCLTNKKQLVGATTIEAKPQLKNLIGDSTKLIPTSLRIKKHSKVVKHSVLVGEAKSDKYLRDYGSSKDDAYDVFMKEMEGLL